MAVPIRRRKPSAGIELDSMSRRGRRASIGKGCWPQTSGLLMCDPLLWSDFRAGLPAKCQLSGRGQMLKNFSTRLFHMRPGVRAVENGSRNGMMHDGFPATALIAELSDASCYSFQNIDDAFALLNTSMKTT
ncbi:unnamed protein product [Cercospora beticola]|nr:unnamed protein product [Cercospora beticola]